MTMIKTHRLLREQTIHRPLAEVFPFFADARNLETLTPPWLQFEILTPGSINMQVGTIIQYKLRVHGIPIHWTTAISVWNPPHEFVDVQLIGPYLLWHHRHQFESMGDSTRMIDDVHYRVKFGLFGRIANSLFVRRDLETIFRFRAQTIRRFFDSSVITPELAAQAG